MKKVTSPKMKNDRKPNLPRWMFWEFVYETMAWETSYETVIERVLDRGNDEEIQELIRFCGRDKVKMVLAERPIYLMEHRLDIVCPMFGVIKEETACHKRKVERGMGWL